MGSQSSDHQLYVHRSLSPRSRHWRFQFLQIGMHLTCSEEVDDSFSIWYLFPTGVHRSVTATVMSIEQSHADFRRCPARSECENVAPMACNCNSLQHTHASTQCVRFGATCRAPVILLRAFARLFKFETKGCGPRKTTAAARTVCEIRVVSFVLVYLLLRSPHTTLVFAVACVTAWARPFCIEIPTGYPLQRKCSE